MPRTLWWTLVIGLIVQPSATVHAQEAIPVRVDRFGEPLPPGVLARLGTLRFHRCDCAAYSPDGKLIATGESDGVQLYDAATGKRLRLLPTDRWRGATGVFFSHDGKRLAAVVWGGTSIRVWDLASFKSVDFVQAEGGSGGGDWSRAAAFSADDRKLVSATSARFFVWDIASGKKLDEFPFRVKDKPVRARFVAFSDDGKFLATQSGKKLHLWDAQTGKLLHDSPLLSNGESMAFSPDGKLLAVPGRGHWMSIFSVESGKKLHSVVISEMAESVAFSRDGKTLALASNARAEHGQVIQLWDVDNFKAPPIKHEATGIQMVRFSPDGKTLAWGCYRQTVRFMDRATGKDQRPAASHRGAIKALAHLPDGKRIVSASEDGDIRVWNADTGESLRVLLGHAGEVSGLALFPNGKRLASCGRDSTFRLWDLESGKSVAVLEDEGNRVVAAAFSKDGKQLASGGGRGLTFLRDLATGKIVEEFAAAAFSSLAFSTDGKTIAALGDGLALLDIVTKKVKVITFEKGGSSVAYSPDGNFLAVACDETLHLLDTATNRVLRTLPGHANRRGCVTFSPDSRYLASVSDGYGSNADRTIRVFELATGTEIHSFKKELPIYAAAFSPDGSKLVVGGADATAVILDLRNLTGKQRRPQLTEKELTARWENLAAADAGKAYEARVDLLHAPASAVGFLARRLQPSPAIDAGRVAGWIKDLDSKDFGQRDRAFKELGELRELVRKPVQDALAGKRSEEKRRRLAALLARLEQLAPAQLRQVRGIEILENIGTPEALKFVNDLTKGNPAGLATTESRLVLARLEQKKLPLPEVPNPQAIAKAASPRLPPPGPIRADGAGDPMPAGAIARLGSARWRLSGEPRRILVSPDGKVLGVVNDFLGLETFDAQTGRSIRRAKNWFPGLVFDVRMAMALSQDWEKSATLDVDDKSIPVLAVVDRVKGRKVRIPFRRPTESYPIVPEEIESASWSGMNYDILSGVEFSPDGNVVVGSVKFYWEASGSNFTKKVTETHLVAWNASTGKKIWKTLASATDIVNMIFALDGTLTVVDQASIAIWDATKGRELRRWQSSDPIHSARYSPDRKWLATGSKAQVLLWDAGTGKVQHRLALPGKEIKAIAFSPDGKLLAGGGDKTMRLWDVPTGKPLGDIAAATAVQAVAFAGDGKTLFSGHEQENVLRRWDVATRKPIGELTGPTGPVRMLSFAPDSRTILATTMGEEFHLWETETGKPRPLPKKDDEHLIREWLASSGRADLLRCEEGFGAQLAMLFTGKVDRLDRLPGFLGSSIDGQRILVQVEKDKRPCLTILKAGNGKVKDSVEREFLWKDGEALSAALSPDGKTVVAAGPNVVCFYDVLTGRERRYGEATNVKSEFLFRTQAVKFALDGARIALAGNEGKVRILAVKDGGRLADFDVTKHRHLTGMAFAPDGQTLLTTSFNESPQAWEVATGQLVRKLDQATHVFSPDNRMLASSAASLRVLDLYSGAILRDCKAEDLGFGNFAFSPNSKFLAAGCSDTTIVVFPTASDESKNAEALDETKLARVLAEGSAAEAYPAIGRLIADPERALGFLERRLKLAPKSEKPAALSAEDIFHVRAVQALERIGTKRARRLLDNLAQGAEASPRTRAAAEALGRMEAR